MGINYLIDSFFSIFEKGGIVLSIIFIQFLILWYFVLQKYFYFKNEFQKDFMFFKNKLDQLNINSLLVEYRAKKEISILNQKMKSSMSIIQLMVMLAPLLGLLGTVTGMVSVFDVMAVAGSGNARAMASGISKATIPTMAGMIGALTGLFFVNYLKVRLKEKRTQIDEYVANWALRFKKI